MLLLFFTQTMSSGNPSALVNLQPGGAGVQTAGTQTAPWLSGPIQEPVIRSVYDFTIWNPLVAGTLQSFPTTNRNTQRSMPAQVGQLVCQQQYLGMAAGQYGGQWALAQIAQQALPRWAYGIVNSPGLNTPYDDAAQTEPGGEIQVIVEGYCNAYCTTGSTTPIAVGTPLVADGQGNLTAAPTASGTAPSVNASALTITPKGQTGSSTWGYQVAAIAASGASMALITQVTTATGNLTLTPYNFNNITWTAGTGAAYYVIVRSAVPGGQSLTTGIIGYTAGLSFNDMGQPSQGAYGGATTTVFSPIEGTVLGVAMGSLAINNATPVLVPVKIGGYS